MLPLYMSMWAGHVTYSVHKKFLKMSLWSNPQEQLKFGIYASRYSKKISLTSVLDLAESAFND